MASYSTRKLHRSFSGTTGFYSHASKAIGQEMNFSVFVPEQAQNRKVPVVYFLSGLTCTEENFMVKAGAQAAAARLGLMLVCCDTSPRGLDIPGVKDHWDFGEGAGFYVNATQEPWSKSFRMYDYVNDELPSLIESTFPVRPDRKSLMGHSMGGHGALVIGLRNSTRYQAVSAFAPICAPMQCPWGEKAFGNYLGADRTTWEAYDATRLVRKAERKIPLKVDQGSVDDFLDGQLKPELLVAACKEASHPLEFHMRDGYDHSYYFIASFVADHLEFHAKHLA